MLLLLLISKGSPQGLNLLPLTYLNTEANKESPYHLFPAASFPPFLQDIISLLKKLSSPLQSHSPLSLSLSFFLSSNPFFLSSLFNIKAIKTVVAHSNQLLQHTQVPSHLLNHGQKFSSSTQHSTASTTYLLWPSNNSPRCNPTSSSL